MNFSEITSVKVLQIFACRLLVTADERCELAGWPTLVWPGRSLSSRTQDTSRLWFRRSSLHVATVSCVDQVRRTRVARGLCD
jgi:hypothetical protein